MLVQRKAKTSGARSSSSAQERSVRKVGPPSKVKDRMRMEVVIPISSTDKGKRRAAPSPSPSVSAFPGPSTDVPPVLPEAPPVASSSTVPHACMDRPVPVPPARASVLNVQWSQEEMERVVCLDPVELFFENDRLRRLLALAYRDQEQDCVINAQNTASYEAEIAYYQQQRSQGE